MLHSCWSNSFVMIVLKTKISCSRKYLKKRNSFGSCVKKKKKKILCLSPPSSFRPGSPATPPRAPSPSWAGPAASPSPFPLSLPPADRPGPPVSSFFSQPTPRSFLSVGNRRAEPRAHDPPLSLFPRASEAFEEPRARALFFLPHSPSSPLFSSHPSAEKKLPEQQAPPRVVPPFGALLPRFVPWVSIASFLASSWCSFRSVSWSLGSVSANSIELHGRRPWSGSRLVSPAALSLESSSLRPPLSPGSFGSQNHAP